MFVFAFLAGVFSILSPCVLPLIPIALGSAVSEHRAGPVALAAGLTISFVTIGMFVATIGYSLGLDNGIFRSISAVMLMAIGSILIVPRFQARLATAAGPFSNWADQRFGGFSPAGLKGQFALGLLLGAIWSPCVGPTLGAASLMAAQGENLAQAALVMVIFGIGAAVPVMALGLVSQAGMMRWRNRMLATGRTGKLLLGLVLLTVGAVIITGMDKAIETSLVQASPAWLIDLTSRF